MMLGTQVNNLLGQAEPKYVMNDFMEEIILGGYFGETMNNIHFSEKVQMKIYSGYSHTLLIPYNKLMKYKETY